MRVLVVGFHVSLLHDPGGEDPHEHETHDSLPHGPRNVVLHFLVQEMDLLESLEIVLLSRLVSDGPDSEIVHVGEVLPGVLEIWTLLENLVLERVLPDVSVRSNELTESLEASLGMVQLS